MEAVEATPAPPQPLLLPSEPDRYGGVLVDSSALPSDPAQFQQVRDRSYLAPVSTRRPQLTLLPNHLWAHRPRRGAREEQISW